MGIKWAKHLELEEAMTKEVLEQCVHKRDSIVNTVMEVQTEDQTKAMTLMKAAEQHRGLEATYSKVAKRLAADTRRKDHECPKKGVKSMAQAIKQNSTGTINFLKVEDDGDQPPRHIADPEEMDKLIIN